MAKRRLGVEYSPSILEPVRPGAVSPDRALCLPTFSHFVIANKTSLSLSLSPSTARGPCSQKTAATKKKNAMQIVCGVSTELFFVDTKVAACMEFVVLLFLGTGSSTVLGVSIELFCGAPVNFFFFVDTRAP